jgi:hypothetical protein
MIICTSLQTRGRLSTGTYKVRNEIETKRNEINENETKRNEINKNETKRNEINERKTKSTKIKRNRKWKKK